MIFVRKNERSELINIFGETKSKFINK